MEAAGFTVISKANGKPAGQPGSQIIDRTRRKTPRKENGWQPQLLSLLRCHRSIAFCLFVLYVEHKEKPILASWLRSHSWLKRKQEKSLSFSSYRFRVQRGEMCKIISIQQ